MKDDRTMYVMLFSPKMEQLSRDKIRNYIQIALQAEIEKEADRLAAEEKEKKTAEAK